MLDRLLRFYLQLNYPVTVMENDDYFTVSHPDLPGCEVTDHSLAECYQQIYDLRHLWLKKHLEAGAPVPTPGSYKSGSIHRTKSWKQVAEDKARS
ncbi:MAG: type II toxin-antitoxin system HicB family antitoxin [Myxococcota bacterium]|nr:type II toxin-antitoxin system HicB family antitoxin [Myxococcota bacterium]